MPKFVRFLIGGGENGVGAVPVERLRLQPNKSDYGPKTMNTRINTLKHEVGSGSGGPNQTKDKSNSTPDNRHEVPCKCWETRRPAPLNKKTVWMQVDSTLQWHLHIFTFPFILHTVKDGNSSYLFSYLKHFFFKNFRLIIVTGTRYRTLNSTENV